MVPFAGPSALLGRFRARLGGAAGLLGRSPAAGGALAMLLDLQEVRCIRGEVAAHLRRAALVERWPVGFGRGGMGTDFLGRALEPVQIQQWCGAPDVPRDFSFRVARAVELVARSSAAPSQWTRRGPDGLRCWRPWSGSLRQCALRTRSGLREPSMPGSCSWMALEPPPKM